MSFWLLLHRLQRPHSAHSHDLPSWPISIHSPLIHYRRAVHTMPSWKIQGWHIDCDGLHFLLCWFLLRRHWRHFRGNMYNLPPKQLLPSWCNFPYPLPIRNAWVGNTVFDEMQLCNVPSRHIRCSRLHCLHPMRRWHVECGRSGNMHCMRGQDVLKFPV